MSAHSRLVIRNARAEDGARIIDALARPLASSELARWLLPGANTRGRLIRDRVCALIAEPATAVDVTVVEVDRGIRGAMVWTTCAPEDPAGRPAGHGDPDSHRIRQLETRLAQWHPRAPHNHLRLIGVSPDYQRRGVGTALLADWHSRTGRVAPCYLMATEPLAALARQFGYRTVGQQVKAALSAPSLWAMWRPVPEREDLAPAAAAAKDPVG